LLKSQITKTIDQLKDVFGESEVSRLGRRSGFEKRARSITTRRFVSSLLHSLGTRRIESLADLLRDFNYDHDTHIHYKPYYNRLDCPGFPELMRQIFESMMSGLCSQVLKPIKNGPFQRFKDILLHDGTSFALHDGLAKSFKGRFTTVSPAAVELHTTMSLFYDNFTCVTATSDSECERHFTPPPEELKDTLFLADRGFHSFAFMTQLSQNGASFIIRGGSSWNPDVVKLHRVGLRYRQLEGRSLNQVLKRLPKGKTHDIEVRARSGKGFRIAIKWSGPKRGWMRLVTNLDRREFRVADILQAYRLRWQVELYYKELKSYANLHAFSTAKQHIAEGLIWAALCVAFLKRYFAHACQRASRRAISTRRVAMCSHAFLADLFLCLYQGLRALQALLEKTFRFLHTNAGRSNPKRERRKGRLALGLHQIGPMQKTHASP